MSTPVAGRARPQGGSTLRFLLQDDRFPRAVNACLGEVRAHLKELPRAEEPIDACAMASLLVASAPVARLTLGGLGGFLDEVQVALGEVHGRIERTYFDRSPARWQPEAAAS